MRKSKEGVRGVVTWAIIMTVGAILFGLCSVLPFRMHSHASSFVVSSSKPVEGCANSGSLSPVNQCITWDAPTSMHAIGLAAAAAFIVLGVFTVWYARRFNLDARRQQKIAVIHLALVGIVLIGGALGYALLRSHGQATQTQAYITREAQARYAAGYRLLTTCNPVTVVSAHCAQLQAEGRYLAAPTQPDIGYGMLPAYFVLAAALYVVPPLLNWYRLIDPRYIRGQKKEALFQ